MDNKANLDIARQFIQNYISARQGLKELGILRSERTLQSDYAEWIVAHLLDLKLEINPVQKDYDARDVQGKTYQIKSRLVENISQNTSFDFASSDLNFDFFIGFSCHQL